MQYLKITLLTFFSIIVGSFKAKAFNQMEDLPLPMSTRFNDFSLTKAREFLLTGDGILLIGFLLWIVYVVLFFSKDPLKES